MWKLQMDQQRKAERERLRAEREHTELEIVTPELDNFGIPPEDDRVERQIVIKSINTIFPIFKKHMLF